MGLSSKIVWTLGGVLLMSSAFAGQKEGDFSSPTPAFGKPSMSEVSRRLESVERKLDQISETKVSDVLGGKNPPSSWCSGSTGFFTNLSFLYWKAFNRGWIPAFERRSPTLTPSGGAYMHYDPVELDFDFSPGIRCGFGYNSGYDAWNVQGIYTWIRFGGSRDFIAKEHSSTLGIFSNDFYGSIGGSFRTLEARWRLNHHIADLQMARGFFITKALALEPVLGVRFASLDQSMNTHFGENISSVKYYSYHISNDYWGIGPRIGIDGKWTFPHNVGLTGLITGSLLYGKLNIDQHSYTSPIGTFGPLEESGSTSSSEYMIAPNVQLALGLDWGMCFNKDRMYWSLNLGWEFNYWWNHAHFDTYREIQFPIEMQGITLKSDLQF